MDAYEVKNFSFKYKGTDKTALTKVSFTVSDGDFLLVMGNTGSGKSTLLRSLKPGVAPAGEKQGEISFFGTELGSVSGEQSVREIGFVFQDPNTQIVCDGAKEEMCFAAQNLGVPSGEIKRRMAEISAMFGLGELLEKKTSELSGGEKQILSLMGVLMTRPRVILLDEPLSQLDPVCAGEFLNALERLNKEFGMTVIISEHNTEQVLALADRVLLLDGGEAESFGNREECAACLTKREQTARFMPASVRLSDKLGFNEPAFTVVEARKQYLKKADCIEVVSEKTQRTPAGELLRARGVTFRYNKRSKNVLSGINLSINGGTALALVGGNASGKSTLLSLLAGANKPVSGTVKRSKGVRTVLLPQNPLYTFLGDTVEKDLQLLIRANSLDADVIDRVIKRYGFFSGIWELFNKNPLDLSTGEVQKTALLKVLMLDAQVILLDEAEKGLDMSARKELGQIIKSLTDEGRAVVFVSHNPGFVYENADRVAMLFGSEIVTQEKTRTFFTGNEVYTTTMGKISAGITDSAFTLREVGVRSE